MRQMRILGGLSILAAVATAEACGSSSSSTSSDAGTDGSIAPSSSSSGSSSSGSGSGSGSSSGSSSSSGGTGSADAGIACGFTGNLVCGGSTPTCCTSFAADGGSSCADQPADCPSGASVIACGAATCTGSDVCCGVASQNGMNFQIVDTCMSADSCNSNMGVQLCDTTGATGPSCPSGMTCNMFFGFCMAPFEGGFPMFDGGFPMFDGGGFTFDGGGRPTNDGGAGTPATDAGSTPRDATAD